jgi:hypothetical protein
VAGSPAGCTSTEAGRARLGTAGASDAGEPRQGWHNVVFGGELRELDKAPGLGAAAAMEGEVQEWSAATRIRRRHREASSIGSWSLATRRARAMANREEQRKERLGWASCTADELHGWEELGARHGKAPRRGAPWQGEEDAREREESRARRVRWEEDTRGREKQGGNAARKKHGVRELKKRMSSSAGKYQRSRRLKKIHGRGAAVG